MSSVYRKREGFWGDLVSFNVLREKGFKLMTQGVLGFQGCSKMYSFAVVLDLIV